MLPESVVFLCTTAWCARDLRSMWNAGGHTRHFVLAGGLGDGLMLADYVTVLAKQLDSISWYSSKHLLGPVYVNLSARQSFGKASSPRPFSGLLIVLLQEFQRPFHRFVQQQQPSTLVLVKEVCDVIAIGFSGFPGHACDSGCLTHMRVPMVHKHWQYISPNCNNK